MKKIFFALLMFPQVTLPMHRTPTKQDAIFYHHRPLTPGEKRHNEEVRRWNQEYDRLEDAARKEASRETAWGLARIGIAALCFSALCCGIAYEQANDHGMCDRFGASVYNDMPTKVVDCCSKCCAIVGAGSFIHAGCEARSSCEYSCAECCEDCGDCVALVCWPWK